MAAVTVDSKGRVRLPPELREELGLRPGDTLLVDRDGGTLRLAKTLGPLEAAVREALALVHGAEKIDLHELAGKYKLSPRRLRRAIDEALDVEEAHEARAEANREGFIPWEQAKADLGLG